MRRSTRFSLAISLVLLVFAGAYTAYWFALSSRVESSVVGWVRSVRAEKFDVSWRQIRVTGFPIELRVDFDSAMFKDTAITPSPELRVPTLSGIARPWDLANWRLAAPRGFTADFASVGGRAPATLTAQSADGVVSIEPDGSWGLWLTLPNATVEAGPRIVVGSTHATLTVPPAGSAGPIGALAVN